MFKTFKRLALYASSAALLTASLIGGHGTSIAWSPRLSELGIESAGEIGVACATFGLIIASLMGGPIAQYLIKSTI